MDCRIIERKTRCGIKGRIIKNISNKFSVEIKNEEIYECVAKGKMKQDDIIPVVGDWVEIEILDKEAKEGIITKIEERKTYIKRPKIANITQIIFVVSLKTPKPDLLLLDKQLVYAQIIGVNPIICLNKIDLEKDKEVIDELVEEYEKIGYKVIQTNAKEKQGIQEIRKILKNNITAFSGNSGVGKSTLTNSIFNKEITLEGEVSNRIKRGKNTTTSATLYKLENNTYIADTPGFSTFELQEVESNELDKYFAEFIKYIPSCEYLGCNHIKEEKCGIKKAVSENKISNGRYERYCKIYQKLKESEERRWL